MDEFDREECMNPENKPYHHEGCPYNEECAVRNSIDREKVIKKLHDARRYLEDKEWSDRRASPHIDAINDALALMKEQEAVVRCKDCQRRGTYDCPVYVGGDGMCSEPDDWFCADGVAKDNISN